MRDLRNAVVIPIENAGHNLFDAPSGDLLDTIDRFMNRQPVEERTIRVELPALFRR